MELTTQMTPACRLPQFIFVDVYKPISRRPQILSSFTVGDLKNKVTEETITEALQKADKHLIK